MLRSIDKQSGESVESVLKKTRMLFLTPNQQCQSTEGKLASNTYFIQGRRHGFESGGGQIVRAERAENFFLTPPLFGQWGGQNIAYIDKSA